MEDQMLQIRSAMENMQSRLVMTENVLVEAKAAIAKTAGLVDTRSIGKAPSLSGEHKEWHDWSFQLTASPQWERLRIQSRTVGTSGRELLRGMLRSYWNMLAR